MRPDCFCTNTGTTARACTQPLSARTGPRRPSRVHWGAVRPALRPHAAAITPQTVPLAHGKHRHRGRPPQPSS